VIFSTQPGATAFDTLYGPGIPQQETGPFARALANAIATPGSDFEDFFSKIQSAVLDETFGRQKPLVYGTIPRNFSITTPDGKPSRSDYANPMIRARRVAFDSEGNDTIFAYSGSYALLIGEAKYSPTINGIPSTIGKAWPDLSGVKSDIDRVDKILREQHGFETTIVWNATYNELQDAFRKFFSIHGRKDKARLLVYYAGHGHTTQNHGVTIGWIVPSDAPDPALYPEEFALTALSMRRIEEYSEFVKAKHILWVFDSCFSGSIFAMNMRGQSAASLEMELLTRPVRRVITSGSEGETVPDKSIFADLFLNALGGSETIGQNKSILTANDLGEWLHREVYKYRRGEQTPQNGTVVIRGLDRGEVLFRLEHSLMSKSSP
jgi:Caspase domain